MDITKFFNNKNIIIMIIIFVIILFALYLLFRKKNESFIDTSEMTKGLFWRGFGGYYDNNINYDTIAPIIDSGKTTKYNTISEMTENIYTQNTRDYFTIVWEGYLITPVSSKDQICSFTTKSNDNSAILLFSNKTDFIKNINTSTTYIVKNNNSSAEVEKVNNNVRLESKKKILY